MKKVKKLAARYDFVGFALVGVINTVLDFILLNVFVSIFDFRVLVANALSTTIVLIFSYHANSRLVFRSGGGKRKIALFLVGTLIGLYAIQLGIIWVLTEGWTTPLSSVLDALNATGETRETLLNNGAKFVATAASMVWNYFYYKTVVFKENK